MQTITGNYVSARIGQMSVKYRLDFTKAQK